ncbi:MAG: hypothetical protein LBC22_02690 [Endomicrobium sp.]|jgi:hypothetical protein|nr:hypothetical protein [Endomicrobium sp.]
MLPDVNLYGVSIEGPGTVFIITSKIANLQIIDKILNICYKFHDNIKFLYYNVKTLWICVFVQLQKRYL